jgi:polyhydroxyalkanoate synthase subunit PhaC
MPGETPGEAVDARLAEFAGEVARLGPDAVAAALDREIARRAAAFVAGLGAYRQHPYHRRAVRVPTRWRQGAARLLDYGGEGGGPTVVIVPSLINRGTILDLLPERSFVRHLARAGLRPLVLDWGEPGAAERDFSLGDYITGPLDAAIAAAAELAGGPVAVCGYCMGGLLALALALRRPADTACLMLLATPWDFHAKRREQAQLLASMIELLPLFLSETEPLPVAVIQSLFMALDPFLAERKFIRFAGLDMAGTEAKSFVALEDWINDGVPLVRRVALECARSWYRDNDPARGCWQVAGRPVRPSDLALPSLVVLPSRDRIVPPLSAAPLAAAIPDATVLRPPFGHIGMMASTAAPQAVWQPIAAWLRRRLIAAS